MTLGFVSSEMANEPATQYYISVNDFNCLSAHQRLLLDASTLKCPAPHFSCMVLLKYSALSSPKTSLTVRLDRMFLSSPSIFIRK